MEASWVDQNDKSEACTKAPDESGEAAPLNSCPWLLERHEAYA